MKLFTTLALASMGIASLTLLSSCQDEDFGYTTEEVRASVYDRNFLKHYEGIPESQSWDVSSSGLISRIKAAREIAEQAGHTRGTSSFSTSGSWCEEKTSETVGDYTVTATKSAANAFTESHDLIQWVKKRLQEGDRRFLYGDHRTNKEEFNQRFSMIATEKSFQLMPVFQGIDNTIWDLHAVIEWVDEEETVEANKHKSIDIVLWRKSEGMTMQGERPNLMGESLQDYVFKKSDGSFWSVGDLGSEKASVLAKDPNGTGIKYVDGASDARKALDIDPQGDVRFETTRLAADIKSQWVTVTGYPEKISTINFYLHVLQDNDNVNANMTGDNANKFWSDGRETPGSITSNMVVLPVQVDIKEYEDREIVLMGCETALSSKLGGKSFNESEVYNNDGNGKSYDENGNVQKTKHDYGDDDMNDIVFLLVGDEVSKKLPELVNENEIAKRYFFEDLGSVVDWDFNDVVLDMKQEITQEYANSTFTTKIKQTATLKHRCGTTPFDLFYKNNNGEYIKLDFNDSKLIENGHIKGVNEGAAMEYSQTITLVDGIYSTTENYPWRPSENNVAIKVYPSSTVYKDKVEDGQVNTDGVWAEYKDRSQGARVPRVFVADQSVWWTPEDITFPNIWKPAKDMTAEEKAKIDQIMSMPAGATPNDLSNGTIYGIASDRSFRYPKMINGEFVLWNTPTRFDRWEPLWLSEGFMEGLNQGYNTVNIEFGTCNTEYALLYRADYQAQDNKFSGEDFSDHSNPQNSTKSYTIPTGNSTTQGTIEWYKEQAKTLSPSFGIQDYGDWSNENGSHIYTGNEGSFYITINKVWMSKGSTPSAPTNPQPDAITNLNSISSTNFNLTFEQLAQAGATSDDCTIRFNISNTSGDGRNGWGNGGIYPYMSTNQDADGRLAEWSGKTGNSWTYEYTLGQLKELAGSGAAGIRILTWNQCDVTKIEIVQPSAKPEPVQQDITLGTECNFVINSWSDAAKISSTQLSGIKVGDKFIITLKDVKNGAQLQVSEMSNDWSNKIVPYYDLNGSTSKEIEVTDDNIDAIKHGMAIQGHDYTLVKVEYVEKPSGEDTPAPSLAEEIFSGSMTISANSNYNQIQNLDETSNTKLVTALNNGKNILKFYIDKNLNINVVCKDWGKIAEGITPVANDDKYVATLELTSQNITDIKNKGGIAMQQVPTEYTLSRITIE